jgi:photosystem II stability/assembly factor-like uncharacterized protein
MKKIISSELITLMLLRPRKLIYLILFTLFFTGPEIFSQSGWNIIHNNYTQNYCIEFINVFSGWVAGASGCFQTTNGGSNWIFRLTGRINSINFVSIARGYAVGFDQNIYYTTNGGFSWITQYTGSFNLELRSIDNAVGSGTFLAVGDSGIVLKTSNFGANWYPMYIGTPEQLRTVYFIDGITGWIGSTTADSNNGQIFKTTNSGLNWFIQNNTSQKGIWAFSFISSNTGWAAALKGVILKTTNGGDNWIIQLNSNIHFYSVFFTDINHGWIAGSSPNTTYSIDTAIIKYTSNSGINWIDQYKGGSGVDNIVHSIFFIDDSIGWAALSDGKILKTTNGGNPIGIKPINGKVPKEYYLYQNYPNPFNPVTTINYELPITNYVNLSVYDILGREAAVLVNEKQTAGKYKVEWNASSYPSGVYFYQLSAGDYSETKKMVLLK